MPRCLVLLVVLVVGSLTACARLTTTRPTVTRLTPTDTLAVQTWPRHPCHLWGRKTTGLARGADDMCRRSYTPRLLS